MIEQNKVVDTLICFPFAGAGSSFYSKWGDFFTNLTIVPIQLPGRERLIDEEPYRNIHKAADEISKQIISDYSSNNIALFGHCFLGATLAFEVTRRLEEAGIEVNKLFISAASSPRGERTYSLVDCNDDEVVEELKKLTGFTHPAFDIPELRELLIPTLRADFEMDETYVPESNNFKIEAAIAAVYADEDDFVSKSDVERWQECTTGEYTISKVHGEHMYLSDQPEQCIEFISNTLNLEWKDI